MFSIGLTPLRSLQVFNSIVVALLGESYSKSHCLYWVNHTPSYTADIQDRSITGSFCPVNHEGHIRAILLKKKKKNKKKMMMMMMMIAIYIDR